MSGAALPHVQPILLLSVAETWESGNGWRTNITLPDLAAFQIAEFRLKNHVEVRIPMEEFRRLLPTVPSYPDHAVASFDVDPHLKRINGEAAEMVVLHRSAR